MSAYETTQTEFHDQECLLMALDSLGFGLDKLIIQENRNLIGYQGDTRKETADITIPKKHVGAASNDIGFKKGEDGTYTAIISEFDQKKYGQGWQKKLTNAYSYHKIMKNCKAKGFKLAKKKVKEDGSLELEMRA